MLSHNEAQALISASLDTPLDDDIEQILSDHLATCEECRLFAASSQRLASALRAMPTVPESVAVREGVWAELDRGPQWWNRLGGAFSGQTAAVLSTAAIALLVIAFSAFAIMRITDDGGDDDDAARLAAGTREAIALATEQPEPTATVPPTAAPTDTPVDTPTPAPAETPAPTEAAEAPDTATEPSSDTAAPAAATEPADGDAPAAPGQPTSAPDEPTSVVAVASSDEEPVDLTGDAEATEAPADDTATSSDDASSDGESSDAPTTEPTQQVAAAILLPTEAASPTAAPTEPPAPTATPEPTETPEPTATAEPTATPEPTETPTPEPTEEPTATPEPGFGDVTVLLVEEDGTPIGSACFALEQGDETIAEHCDTPEFDDPGLEDNGTTGFFSIASGTYTLRLTEAPEGVTAEPVEVEIEAGATESVTVRVDAPDPTPAPTETPTPEPTEEPTASPTDAATETPEPEPTDTPTEAPTATTAATETPAEPTSPPIEPQDGTFADAAATEPAASDDEDAHVTDAEPTSVDAPERDQIVPVEDEPADEIPTPDAGGIGAAGEVSVSEDEGDAPLIEPAGGTDPGADSTPTGDDAEVEIASDDDGETQPDATGTGGMAPSQPGAYTITEAPPYSEGSLWGAETDRLTLVGDQPTFTPFPDTIALTNPDLSVEVEQEGDSRIIVICDGTGCQDATAASAEDADGPVVDGPIGWVDGQLIYQRVDGDGAVELRALTWSGGVVSDEQIGTADRAFTPMGRAIPVDGGTLIPAIEGWLRVSGGSAEVIDDNPYGELRLFRASFNAPWVSYVAGGELIVAEETSPGTPLFTLPFTGVDYDLAPSTERVVISTGQGLEIWSTDGSLLGASAGDTATGSVVWVNEGILVIDRGTDTLRLVPVEPLVE